MNIILATGIYPPDIGGPATYVEHLADELTQRGWEVIVIAYGKKERFSSNGIWSVYWVPCGGTFLLRWINYSRALRKYGKHTDAVVAFSSVSCGVPLLLSFLRKPKRVLRLGGDFFWERYTDWGGTRSLREWYEGKDFSIYRYLNQLLMPFLLKQFSAIIFSSEFQLRLYEKYYRSLPKSKVIENVFPSNNFKPHKNFSHPFQLLYVGRFVRFKNLFSLLEAVSKLQEVNLTLVGSGPLEKKLKLKIRSLKILNRAQLRAPVSSDALRQIFDSHDLLVLPSSTEISPNTALEASAAGLPVLLTEENGLSRALSMWMQISPLRTPEQIAQAIMEVKRNYGIHELTGGRPWQQVAEEWDNLLSKLLR